ncbi:MAG: ArnT family glycosyltransferase [Chloroflexota bacterium]
MEDKPTVGLAATEGEPSQDSAAEKGQAARDWGGLQHWLLGAVFLAFLALGSYYTLTNPLFSKPDEAYHYSFVLYLKQGNDLPIVDLSYVGYEQRAIWEPEAHQPPLYYAAVAALSQLLPPERSTLKLNHHFRETSIGNQNPYAPAQLPTPLAAPTLYLARFVSLLCAAAALAFGYLFTRLFFAPGPATLVTACVAFSPQFLFVASACSNDMAGVATAQLGLWQLGRATRSGLSARGGWALGLAIGLATLAKLSGLGLLLPAGVLVLEQWWRRRDRAKPLAGLAVLAGALAVAGWWLLRNWQVYGDPFALRVVPAFLRPRLEPRSETEWQEALERLWKSVWLDFSPGLIRFAEDQVYQVAAVASALAVLGLLALLLRDRRARAYFALNTVWLTLILLSWLRLNAGLEIIMGGGRLLFPAVFAIGATLALGLRELLLRRDALVAPLLVALALFSALAPGRYLDPLYPRPEFARELPRQPQTAAAVSFADSSLLLVGYDLAPYGSGAGLEGLAVTYYWQALGEAKRDYSVALAVQNEYGQEVARLETFPSYGGTATSWWQAGDVIVDRLALPISAGEMPPAGTLVTYLYYDPTGERLRGADSQGQPLPDWRVELATVQATDTGEWQLVKDGRIVASAIP